MAKTNLAGVEKPEKPYPGFPLFAHSRGYWAKKINGKLRYFGPWSLEDPQWEAALAKFHDETQPKVASSGGGTLRLKLAEALNLFLDSRKKRVDNGEMAQTSWREYRSTAKFLLRHFGRAAHVDSLGPSDFESYRQFRATTRDVTSLGNEIQRVRTMVNWITQTSEMKPIDFGPDFKKPGRRAVKASKRKKMESLGITQRAFEPDQIHWILSECGLQLRAMVMLGINAGYYPSDCDELLKCHLDFNRERPWLSVPRAKNEEERDAWLWPETVEAIQTWLNSRAANSLKTAHVFRRPGDLPWNDGNNIAGKHFVVAMRGAGIRTGSFRWLRNTFETVAGETGDQVAVDRVMGHIDGSMGAVYRQGVQPARIVKVCNHVREWLYG